MSGIAAGIILFNPDLDRLRENIDAIYNQVQLLVLVDNNSSNIHLVEEEYKARENIIIVKNNNNIGIAAALNQLMSYCQSKDYSWVLTLDQDSVCPNNLVREYVKYLNIPKIALISPVIIDRNKNSDEEINKTAYNNIEKCITSATLTNVSIWEEIGGFDDLMFIDLVDFEYCKRIVLNGFKIIRVNNVVLLHEIGHITQHKFLIWNIDVKNHSAFRKYYMARNIIYYAKKYKTTGSIIIAYMRIMKLLAITMLYEKDKGEKGRAIFKGIKSGRKLKVSI
ncbi:TPA: glycosyltransferase [Bacillus cereus]|uniref:glycosyltransferase n=1 Tax=Bacillus cereus TaxID=1396 RepID=UPI001F23D4A1|nr:glycosyltransferase [Bacillus cereus]BCC14773.1 glycosyl transferase family 2 [Bacillus cereus]